MGSAIKTRTLKRGPKEGAFIAPARQLFLVIDAGHPTAGSSRHALFDVDEVEIGRGARRQWSRAVTKGVRRLRIDVPDEWMSTVHVNIRVRAASVIVTDADSKNGTVVNGRPISGAELADGDVLEAGRTLFYYAAAMPTQVGGALDVVSDGQRMPIGLRTLIPELAQQFDELTVVASSPAPILVLGETGTGKELVARAIHELSRRSGSFVAVNCGAIAPSLIESELFGHRKGAFSGATSDRVGVIEASSAGTLFLDELGEIPPRVQIALLRVLQEQEVMSVGASHAQPVELRVVAATNRDVSAAVADGILRDDLVARLRGYELELLPLAQRIPDLGLLIAELLIRLAGDRAEQIELDVDVVRSLIRHSWPRNIRELERCLETAIALAGSEPIGIRHLRIGASAAEPSAPSADDADADARRAELVVLLEQHQGNVSAIAKATGKKRQQIQKWLRRFGIDPVRYR